MIQRLDMASPDDKSYLTTIAIAFAVAITCIAVSLRYLARRLHKIALGADDGFMAVGAVSTTLTNRGFPINTCSFSR